MTPPPRASIWLRLFLVFLIAVPVLGILRRGAFDVRPDPEATRGVIELQPPHAGPHWSYSGNHGPSFWAALSPRFAACGSGTEQSPIDLRDAVPGPLPPIVFGWHRTGWRMKNNGHTLEMEYGPGSAIRVGSRAADLAQFHFHTPSEHTFGGGTSFEVELHAVHALAGVGNAVVGIMLRRGAPNPALPGNLEQLLPAAAGVAYTFPTIHFDLAGMLPEDRSYFTYPGSLTTPPGTEGVTWLVLRNPVEVSDRQMDVLKAALHRLEAAGPAGNNNRPTQPRNGRALCASW